MEILQTLNQPLVEGNENLSFLTKGSILTMALGAVALYLFIPERKKKNLFK